MAGPTTRMDYVVRGLVIGISLGVVAGLFGMDMTRGIILGGLCGGLAGITLHNIRQK